MRITQDSLTLSPSNGSLAGDLTSSAQQLESMYGYSVQVVWTGAPVGTLSLQASLNGSDWSTVSGSSTSLSGAADSFLWNFQGAFYHYVRLNYVRTSGTGTITKALYFAKGV